MNKDNTQNGDQVVIYTRNLMKQVPDTKDNNELIGSLENLLKTAAPKYNFDLGIIEIPRPSTLGHKITDDRGDYEITAKLFLLSSTTSEKSFILQSLYYLFRLLGINYLDTLIIDFHGHLYTDEDQLVEDGKDGKDEKMEDGNTENKEEKKEENRVDFNYITDVWQELEKLYDGKYVGKLGVSEFNMNRLKKLIDATRVKPKIDQINIKNLCAVPRELIEFGKVNNVELLTHSDSDVILPQENFHKIIKRCIDSIKKATTDKVLDGFDENEYMPRWVIKYSVEIKCRGIVANKGYIVMASKSEPGVQGRKYNLSEKFL